MNKIWLIIQREFLNRVQKKSFLIATILVPLIFPAIIAGLAYVEKQQEKSRGKEIIHYVDDANLFQPDTSAFTFKKFHGSFDDAKAAYQNLDDYGLLYIPEVNIDKPEGIILYSKKSRSIEEIGRLESILESQFRDLKIQRLNIDKKVLDDLKTSVNIKNVNVSSDGTEKSSNTLILSAVGTVAGILMYMFIFLYGAQIMQGVIEEKTSKVVEVIVSSVSPFQLMMGKIFGLASVGLLQFTIWIILMSTVTFGVLGSMGISTPQQQTLEQISPEVKEQQQEAADTFTQSLTEAMEIPWALIAGTFIFFFLGGYLLYGALFAAIGSAVDSPAEAQQFMFPLTVPMLISYMSLFIFVLRDPHGTVSVWLSIIPFTSPIAMIGRIGFDVPLWQLLLSMILLVAGFISTTWIAGRIYRVGILMHGTKVNYKVLTKWFLQKN
jgi:ABC-2 type transport system permease protein